MTAEISEDIEPGLYWLCLRLFGLQVFTGSLRLNV